MAGGKKFLLPKRSWREEGKGAWKGTPGLRGKCRRKKCIESFKKDEKKDRGRSVGRTPTRRQGAILSKTNGTGEKATREIQGELSIRITGIGGTRRRESVRKKKSWQEGFKENGRGGYHGRLTLSEIVKGNPNKDKAREQDQRKTTKARKTLEREESMNLPERGGGGTRTRNVFHGGCGGLEKRGGGPGARF